MCVCVCVTFLIYILSTEIKSIYKIMQIYKYISLMIIIDDSFVQNLL